MNLFFKIAWRNILRHRGKSFVIIMIIFLGALIMTLGNGVISGMERGLSENIVKGFTGHVVIVSDKQESDAVFMEMMGRSIEPLSDFKKIDSVLKNINMVDRYIPIGKNGAVILNEGGGPPGYIYLIGVDFERYTRFFPSTLKVVEGNLVYKNERGILVPALVRDAIFDVTNIWFISEGSKFTTESLPLHVRPFASNIITKDNIVLMGMGADNSVGNDIRVNIKGIVKYKQLNTIWGGFAIVDIESYRECMGYISAKDNSTLTIPEEDKKLLHVDSGDIEDFFSEEIIDSKTINEERKIATPDKEKTKKENTEDIDIDKGTYNMVLVFLKKDNSLKKTAEKLQKILTEKECGVKVITWNKAVGTIGSMALLIKSSLFIFVMFLFFVATIIIVNTLSMAALERTSEIGMMRAIGASKGFIGNMFMYETSILSFLAGGAGIILGFLIVNIISLMKISTENDMLQLLFGGDTFRPFLSATDILIVILQLIIVTIIAVLYPIRIATKITPLDAIARE